MSASAGFRALLTRAGIPYDHWNADHPAADDPRSTALSPSSTTAQPPASPTTLPPHRLIVADDPAAFSAVTGATVAEVPMGSAAGAPRFAVAMAGVVPAPVLKEVAAFETRSARDRPLAPVSADVGRLLNLLCRARRARNVLDVGAGVGVATLWMAAGLRQPDGRLVALEKDSARRTMASGAIHRAGLAGAVEYHLGDAARHIDRLRGRFEIVLLDETAEEREGHLGQMFVRGLLAPRALICSHGGLAEPAVLARTYARLQVHPKVTATVSLGVGAGLFLAVTAAA